MDFTGPISWRGITFSKQELDRLRSDAINIYNLGAKTEQAAWIEALLGLLNKKGLLKLPEEFN